MSQDVFLGLQADQLKEDLELMIKIRQFELRAEAAYQQGKIGGFFHSYIGQEAVQTAAMRVLGKDHWWITTYRCHALALLLGVGEKEIMSELFGRRNGNARGRGGSMHLYTDQMLGGYGIVGGQIPIATGAAFSLKYQGVDGKIAICFMGDGAVAQGAFHESLNMASLWDLPCLYVIENNQWGMGTAVNRAISQQPIAESQAPSYGMEALTIDGMDYAHCLTAFASAYQQISESSRPMLIEVVTQRFKGHSISDPGLYRTKDELKLCMQRDPILLLEERLIALDIIDDNWRKETEKQVIAQVKEAVAHADQSPWPELCELEEGVLA